MPTRARPSRWPLALLALLAPWLGCSGDPEPCPEKSLVLVVNLADTVTGDALFIDVLQGQTLVHHGTVARPPGGTRGRIEVDLGDDYLPGSTLRVNVSPASKGALQGRSSATLTLGPLCSRLEMTVTNDPPEPDWSCVGMVDLVTFRTGPMDQDPFHFVDMYNDPIPSATFTACLDFDPACASPVWQGVAKDGVLFPGVGAGFEGFLAVEVDTHDYFPVLLDIVRPLGLMNARPVTVLLKPETVQALGSLAGDTFRVDERGGLTLATFDCRGYRVGDIAFTFAAPPVADPQPRLYILANNWYPDRTLDATDSTGTAFIANLPPGVVRVTAFRKSTGAVISEFSTRIVAGTMTYVAVEPS
jgi:hypothetical protein